LIERDAFLFFGFFCKYRRRKKLDFLFFCVKRWNKLEKRGKNTTAFFVFDLSGMRRGGADRSTAPAQTAHTNRRAQKVDKMILVGGVEGKRILILFEKTTFPPPLFFLLSLLSTS